MGSLGCSPVSSDPLAGWDPQLALLRLKLAILLASLGERCDSERLGMGEEEEKE